MTAKVVFRTIFYQWFILFVGISIGFIANAQWVGHKYLLVEKSIGHIFFPIEYTPELDNLIKSLAKYRLWCELGKPDDFKVHDEMLSDHEFYDADISYVKNGKTVRKMEKTRVRWRPWEMYFEFHELKEKGQN